MKRICTRCKIEKDRAQFYKRKEGIVGFRPWCKSCCREVRKKSKTTRAEKQREHLLNRYGLTVDQYQLLLEVQSYGCAICKRKDSGVRGKKNLAVDHDHETGRIRGLLCNSCNNGLGRFKDNPEFLRCAARYLENN